jgi:hypothetical protein
MPHVVSTLHFRFDFCLLAVTLFTCNRLVSKIATGLPFLLEGPLTTSGIRCGFRALAIVLLTVPSIVNPNSTTISSELKLAAISYFTPGKYI